MGGGAECPDPPPTPPLPPECWVPTIIAPSEGCHLPRSLEPLHFKHDVIQKRKHPPITNNMDTQKLQFRLGFESTERSSGAT